MVVRIYINEQEELVLPGPPYGTTYIWVLLPVDSTIIDAAKGSFRSREALASRLADDACVKIMEKLDGN